MRLLKSFNRIVAALVLSLAMLAGSVQAQIADVVKQVPNEADVIIAIPSLGALNQKLSGLAQSLQLPMPPALMMFKMQSGLQAGLNDAGGAAIAMFVKLGQPEPSTVLYLPVADYAAFMGNFGVQPGAGLTQVTLPPQGGEQVWVKQLGGYAAIAQDQPLLENLAAPAASTIGQKVGTLGSDNMGRSDLMVYVDLGKLGQTYKPMIQMALQQAQQQAANAPGADPAMTAATTQLGATIVNAVVDQSDAFIMGLDVNDAGIGLTVSSQFKAGSAAAQAFAGSNQSPKFDRLTADPFLFAASLDMSSLPIASWMETISKVMPADNAFTKMMVMGMESMKTMTTVQQAWYASAGGPGGLFNMVAVYPTDDPAGFMTSYRNYMKEFKDALPALGQAGQGQVEVTYQENAAQIGGVSADSYKVQMTLPPEVMQNLGPAAMFMQGQQGFIAPANQSVVLMQGTDTAVMERTMAVAGGGGQLEQNQLVAQGRGNLQPNRLMEAYVDLGQVVKAVAPMAMMFMPGVQLELPANTPPIGFSLSATQGGAGYRMHIPTKLIVEIKNIVMKVQMQMQGGPGGPAGAAPPQDDFTF